MQLRRIRVKKEHVRVEEVTGAQEPPIVDNKVDGLGSGVVWEPNIDREEIRRAQFRGLVDAVASFGVSAQDTSTVVGGMRRLLQDTRDASQSAPAEVAVGALRIVSGGVETFDGNRWLPVDQATNVSIGAAPLTQAMRESSVDTAALEQRIVERLRNEGDLYLNYAGSTTGRMTSHTGNDTPQRMPRGNREAASGVIPGYLNALRLAGYVMSIYYDYDYRTMERRYCLQVRTDTGQVEELTHAVRHGEVSVMRSDLELADRVIGSLSRLLADFLMREMGALATRTNTQMFRRDG